MPVEIKEIILKAEVDNKIKDDKPRADLQIQNVNLELLIKKLSKELKSTNER
jgi:hypothetical protein